MWRRALNTSTSRLQIRSLYCTARTLQKSTRPIIEIRNGTFYRQYPSVKDEHESNPALFCGLDFCLPSGQDGNSNVEYWSVISPSSLARTTFLQILAGQHVCIPPTARTYPYLSELSDSPQRSIKYVGFDADRGNNVGGTSVRGAYLSSRYESRREETDFTLLDYLKGNTELNALEKVPNDVDGRLLEEAIDLLSLGSLLSMPVANLSNGQTRRARIAKSLMAQPEILLLDGPFMGLDPNTLARMSVVLQGLAQKQQPRVIVSLRPEDGVPNWISHLLVVNDRLQVVSQGTVEQVLDLSKASTSARPIIEAAKRGHDAMTSLRLSRDGFSRDSPAFAPGEPMVEMQGAKVSYGEKTVLGDWKQIVDGQERTGLWWSLHRGQRCGIFGANGSGKTTMLSLITSDHPQTYSLPIKLFGRTRLPSSGQPGISLFDIQQRMGHSSPEVHAFFPKKLTVRRALESAWADAPMSKPRLTDDARKRVDACLRWFANELNPDARQANVLEIIETMFEDIQTDESPKQLSAVRKTYEKLISADDGAVDDIQWSKDRIFGELSFSSQRLLLFLRAIIKSPDLVILDEALSGIDEATRDKALLYLSHGETLSLTSSSSSSPSDDVEIAPKPSILARIGHVTFPGLEPHQALLVISHAREDVPGCLREWICLPEPGEGRVPRTGTLSGPLELNPQGWKEIWGEH